jgi:hypothetical protein
MRGACNMKIMTVLIVTCAQLFLIHTSATAQNSRSELLISIRSAKEDNSDRPLIFSPDILAFNCRTHEIFLSEDAWTRIGKSVNRTTLGTKGVSFIVRIDGKAIYEGRFWTILYAVRPSSLVILIEDLEKKHFILSPEGTYNLVGSQELFEALRTHCGRAVECQSTQ